MGCAYCTYMEVVMCEIIYFTCHVHIMHVLWFLCLTIRWQVAACRTSRRQQSVAGMAWNGPVGYDDDL